MAYLLRGIGTRGEHKLRFDGRQFPITPSAPPPHHRRCSLNTAARTTNPYDTVIQTVTKRVQRDMRHEHGPAS